MKEFMLTSVALFLTGCAGVIQTGFTSEAYDHFSDGNYEEVLVSISNADSIHETTPELKAELVYLKARTYEAMGQFATARALYKYLVEQHSQSQYAYLAAGRLENGNGTVD
ncbi:MAG: hypothetical protein AAFM91_17425 [Pseudomonadota bacterium]